MSSRGTSETNYRLKIGLVGSRGRLFMTSAIDPELKYLLVSVNLRKRALIFLILVRSSHDQKA